MFATERPDVGGQAHIRRSSSPTTSVPEGPDVEGQAHKESSSGSGINCIHDHPEPKLMGVKGGDQPNFHARHS